MLTEEERREIEHELRASPTPQAVVPDALKIVQKRRRWVSDEAVRDVADFLGLTPAEVDGVATCYNLIFRRPVGRHVILLCDSLSCYATGYEDVFAHLKSRLGIDMGQTTADDRFTLLPIACLGACELAPALMIDDDLHGDLTPAKVDEVLANYA